MPREKTQRVSIEQICLVLMVLFLLTHRSIIIVLAALLLIGSLSEFRIMKTIANVWEQVLEFIGTVTRTILLTAVFYLFLTPYAFLYRAFHRNEEKRFKGDDPGSATSYVASDSAVVTRERFEQVW